MEGGIEMYKINKMSQLLEMISGTAFFHFPLQTYGYDLEKGLILVAEDDKHARLIEKALVDNLDAKSILHCNNREWNVLNYELAIHCYRQNDREDMIQDFLYQNNFTPVLIVGGMVPTGIFPYGYTLRCNLKEKEVSDFFNLYETMKKIFVENPSYLENELSNVNSSKIMMKYKTEANESRFIKSSLAIGKLWAIVLRKKHDENTVEDWLEHFIEFSIDTEKVMEDFGGFYGIGDAVRKCIHKYFQQNAVEIYHLRDEIDLQTVQNYIFFDEENYYFTEHFFKTICEPLTHTVSFLQLKKEMQAYGMLRSDSTKDNYTVKVVCYDSTTESFVRKRFLKIGKEYLETDEGFSLEDILVFQNEEINDFNELEVSAL